jgi:hypothetical protein
MTLGPCMQQATSRLTDIVRVTAGSGSAPMSSFYHAVALLAYVQSRLNSAEYSVLSPAIKQDISKHGTEAALKYGAGICGNHAQAYYDLWSTTSASLADHTRFIRDVRAIQFWVYENKLIPSVLSDGKPNPRYLDSYNHISVEFQYANDSKWRFVDVTWGSAYYASIADRDRCYPLLGWDDIAALQAKPGYSADALLAAARTNLTDAWSILYQQGEGRDPRADDYLGSYVRFDVVRRGVGTITHKPKGTGVRTAPDGQQIQGLVYQKDSDGNWNKPAYFGWDEAAFTNRPGELKLRLKNTLLAEKALTQLLISAPHRNRSVQPDPQLVWIEATRAGIARKLGPWKLDQINGQQLLLDFSLDNRPADELLIYFDPSANGARICFEDGWLHLG